ncbi:class I SAM-dependent methyltransferase [Peredibacter sp. HCB2-198]|uniref:class I SAM-dependent methyltransferase n=1 Tax=Peredibacter sp. HCB2-198 TaxID=3383025 RepID=UPI0038B4C096
MALKLIKDGTELSLGDSEFSELNKFCEENVIDLTFEWISGQFWLHSDIPKEKPIGIEIDRELSRHEEYLKKSSVHKELLAKAIGVKGTHRPQVLDLTAGMLGDSLLMLAFGCEVWATERHPVIRFLIQSALKNAQHPKLQNFHFQATSAQEILENGPRTEVIYFDPMFEDINEKASPRKEMRIFRNVVGSDQDAIQVFEKALGKKTKRLVVKRPRHSANLSKAPSVQYIGKSTRYDVYFSV